MRVLLTAIGPDAAVSGALVANNRRFSRIGGTDGVRGLGGVGTRGLFLADGISPHCMADVGVVSRVYVEYVD